MTTGDCDMAKKLKHNSLPRGALGKSAIMGDNCIESVHLIRYDLKFCFTITPEQSLIT